MSKVDFLEEFKFEFRQKFPTHQTEGLSIVRHPVYDGILTKLEYKVYGVEREEVYELEYNSPLTWWDHLKADKFPKWWLKRFPVKTKQEVRVLRIDHRMLFPDVAKKFAKKNGFVRSKVRADDYYTVEKVKKK